MDELLAAGGLRDRERERVMSVRLLALGRSRADVAEVVGRSVNTVDRHKKRFLAEGEAYLRSPNWGGRRNELLSPEREAEFVATFEQTAGDGGPATASEIAAALAQRAGRTPHPTTVSRMLARHGWRKVVPRPTHPDGDPERRQAFKQTSRT